MDNTPEPVLRCEVVGWALVYRLASKLARIIRAADFHPDIVVAIARGGWIPARLLCDHLDLYNLVSLRIAHYIGAEKSEQARMVYPLGVDIRGKDVLLVDDVSDSGDTLQLALKHIREQEPHQLRVAVLHHKPCASMKPDFFAKQVIAWRWITYPWALVEDLSGFVRRMHPAPKTIEQAAAHLQQEYRIKVSRRILEDVFAQLSHASASTSSIKSSSAC